MQWKRQRKKTNDNNITYAGICQRFLLDCLFGDPYWMPHPVRFMGNLISFLDKKLMGEKHKGEEKKADAKNGIGIKDDATIRSESGKGILLVICVLAATAIVSGIIFWELTQFTQLLVL